MISVTLSEGLQSNLQKIVEKYPLAANRAARKAGFYIQNVCVKQFLSVEDGVAVSRDGVSPTKRTTWPGLRRRTGTLARAVKVGVYDGLSFKTINSMSSPLGEKILSGVAVGIGSELQYGVIHEREGRHQSGRNDSGRNFYPFLEPAMKASEKGIKEIFDKEFLEASKK